MEETGRRGVYRSGGTNCRDRGRFVSAGPDADRFWSKVDRGGPLPSRRPELGPCWPRHGAPNRFGYKRFWVAGRMVLAHRYAWESVNGRITAGLTLDHLCERPACVRPDHLEPVTNAENLRRRHARRTKNGVPR